MTAAFPDCLGRWERKKVTGSLDQYSSWGSIAWKENCYFNSLLLLKIAVSIDSSKQSTGLAELNLESTEVPQQTLT